jgi:hypothetical protein
MRREEMPRLHTLVLLTCAIVLISSSAFAEIHHRVGLGLHYWKALDDALDDMEFQDVDEDGIAWLISYKLATSSLLKFQLDLELLPRDYGGSDHRVVAPEGFVLVGSEPYVALGFGIHYTDGDFAEKPFFALRTGIDFELLPSIFTDININYRFENWDFDEVRDKISTDTLTLGAVVRFQFPT